MQMSPDAPALPTHDPSIEDESWKIAGHHPIWQVNDLADAQVRTHAAEHVGVFGLHMLLPGDDIDHATHRIPAGFHQIRPDARRDLIAFAIQMARYRSMRHEAREAQIRALDELELRTDVHGRLDGSAADLAITLCRVRIPD